MEFDIIPMGAVRMTQGSARSGSKVVQRYFAYKNMLYRLAQQQKYQLEIPLSLTFVLPMAKSWSNKKKIEMNGKFHEQKPDLDNLIKAFKDSILKEDSMVHSYGHMKKIWGTEGKIIIH